MSLWILNGKCANFVNANYFEDSTDIGTFSSKSITYAPRNLANNKLDVAHKVHLVQTSFTQ